MSRAPVEVYLVRHGQSQANVEGVFANRVHGYPLTAQGRRQSEDLAVRLGAELDGRPVASLRTSPILRARQTAAILGNWWAQPVHPPDVALTEFDVGVYEGTTDPGHWEAFTQLMTDWLVHHQWDRRIQGGESYRDIAARFSPFLHQLLASSAPGDVHVLVTHGGLLRCMVPLIASNIDGQYATDHPLDNTAWIRLATTPDQITCRTWGDQQPTP